MSSAIKTPLKYLFHVIYNDGTQFFQNEDDISLTDPMRSAFFDDKQDEVYMFSLHTNDQLGVVISLNLVDGKIYPGGFTVGESGPKPYKLIFYRQHNHVFNVGSMEELTHEVKYCIGYTDADGVEHKIYVE